jgi:hypothetical protein
VRSLAATVLFSILAGCASDPRYAQGLDWVMSNERESVRLQRQGFPQMGTGGGL